MVKVGDDNTILMNTASSVASQDTMIINSDAATLVESDMGTMVINSDDDEASTMKSESRVCLFVCFFNAICCLLLSYLLLTCLITSKKE